MGKLKELEKRLKDEPDNLGLRVMVAGALFEAGRRRDAAELYHSVAIAYRDQGRPQQAIVVCRSLLELAPDDAACQALLASLTRAPEDAAPTPRLTPPQLPPLEDTAEADEPPRRSSIDVTPLPAPLSYHDADPSSLSRPKLSRADLPPSLQREHQLLPEVQRLEGVEGIANAARQISASLLAARPPDPSDTDEVGSHEETLDVDDVVDVTEAEDGFGLARRARIDPHAALEHLGTLRPTVPLGRPASTGAAPPARDPDDGEAGDDELTLPPKLDAIPHARGVDDEKTRPRERPGMAPVASSGERSERTPSKPTAITDPRKIAELARASRGSRSGTAETRSLADRAGSSAHRAGSSADLPEPVTEPRNLADLAPSTRSSRPLISESRSLPGRAALSVDPPDPVTEPRNLADRPRQRVGAAEDAAELREAPRRKPPSIAPATQATGPLASALFAPVPPASRAALLQRFRRRLAGVGTTVIRRGEAGHGLILVVRGRLDVHAEDVDGARVSLDAIGPGDYVGEIGLVSRRPAAAYVVAASDCELLVLDAPAFYDVAGAYPALWAAISAVAERRSRDHAQRLQA
ncbi:MAG: cyclic nucleotide-binding domain-containing protein [Kofleriaceae bacterium]